MISINPIKGFSKKFDVVSLFIINDGKILMLKRQAGKPQEKKWGPPAGKVGNGESLEDAICRETFEETGINVTMDKITKYERCYYVRHGDTDFMFYIFAIEIDSKPEVALNIAEHSEYSWFPPKEALEINLVQDQEIPISDFFKINQRKEVFSS